MSFDSLMALLDWFGVAVFATTGALVASRKEMDLVGFALLGTAAGIGGGTVRDVLLGVRPIFWVEEPAYVLMCVAVSALAFVTAHAVGSRLRLLLWLDAVGLALFAVTGAERAGPGRAWRWSWASSPPPSGGSSATCWATRAPPS